MINPDVKEPNFIVLKQDGPVYKVTICQRTLKVLKKEKMLHLPKNWTPDDFYFLLDEGLRLNVQI